MCLIKQFSFGERLLPMEKDVSFVICNNYDTLCVSQMVLVVKNLPANVGDSRHTGSIPRSGSSPGEGNGNPLHYSCLENPMDRGAWQTTIHGRELAMTEQLPLTLITDIV